MRYLLKRPVVFVSVLLGAVAPAGVAIAGFCWGYSQFTPATTAGVSGNPLPWDQTCGDGFDNPAIPPNTQIIRQTHRNWHCSNGGFQGAPIATEPYGRGFLAFHRQFINDFNNWRLQNTSLGRLEIWDPSEGAKVPGDEETTTDDTTTAADETQFTHCSIAGNARPTADCGAGGSCIVPLASSGVGTCSGGPKNGQACAVCKNCVTLPNTYIGANLDNFSNLGELGWNLDTGVNSWHGTYHNGVQVLGCSDIGGFVNTSRDPAFWMAHSKLDEIAREWQSRQATDVVIVIDRSGSMDDNCSSTTPPPGESPCAINDAKAAATTFADAILDVRMDGGVPAAQQHRIGLASFSSSSSPQLGLTAAAGIVTDDFIDNTPFETALAGISTGGATSIAAGLREAIAILNSAPGGPNPHQAILVLTDGKENTAPCLEGATSPCVSGDVLTIAEVGDIQVVAIGFGPGAEEDNLRAVAERHGGTFVAEANVNDPLSLQKFFVTASGRIYDAGVSVDPEGVMPSERQESEPFQVQTCSDQRLSVVLGYQELERDRRRLCDLQLELFTPSGKQVGRTDAGVEAGHGRRHDFIHVDLPYLGESKGIWKGRVVRSPDSKGQCKAQKYNYNVLAKGFGRIDPFVVRPDVVVGRRILATFRISESNRPKGGFDGVTGEVVLTRPNGDPETYKLYDDGTHGDQLADNNIWSVEIPKPATEPGAYHLRGRFTLTNAGCTRLREADYSLVVNREPKQRANLTCGGVINVRQGERIQLDDAFCLWNRSAEVGKFNLQVRDSEGWLKTVSPADPDALVGLPRSFESGAVQPFDGLCYGRSADKDRREGSIPLYAVTPKNAKPGDRSVISVQAVSGRRADDKPMACETAMVIAGPPDCNQNEIDDAIDIARKMSRDRNQDGVPDECQPNPHFHMIDKM